jgi:hypothetical protein
MRHPSNKEKKSLLLQFSFFLIICDFDFDSNTYAGWVYQANHKTAGRFAIFDLEKI